MDLDKEGYKLVVEDSELEIRTDPKGLPGQEYVLCVKEDERKFILFPRGTLEGLAKSNRDRWKGIIDNLVPLDYNFFIEGTNLTYDSINAIATKAWLKEREDYFIVSRACDRIVCFNSTRYYQSWKTVDQWLKEFDIEDFKKESIEIIWQYHLGSLLQWFGNEINWLWRGGTIEKIDVVPTGWTIRIKTIWWDKLYLDTKKNIMEYSEEQNKELAEFIKIVFKDS